MKHSVSGIFLAILVILIMILSAGCGNNPPTNTTTVVGSGTAPLAPASLTVQVTSTTAITLSWPAVTGAANYNIYRSTFPNVTVNPGNKINPNPVTQTMIQNSNLLANTTYYYIVTSVSANGGESGPSAEVYAKPSTGLIGATVGGTNTNNNPITGIVYGTPNAANPALQIPLLGATVVSNNNVTTTDMNGAYSVGTASSVVELSAAAQGYAAQTIAGIPAATVQNLHLNFLASPISSNLSTGAQNPGRNTVTGTAIVTFTVKNTPAGTPLANTSVCFYSDNPKVNLDQWSSAQWPASVTTDVNGIASATIKFYDGATSTHIAFVAMPTLTWFYASYLTQPGATLPTGFGYLAPATLITPVQLPPGSSSTLPNLLVTTPITIVNYTVTAQNVPAGATDTQVLASLILPNGVKMPYVSTWSQVGGANVTTTIPFPSNVPGLGQIHAVAYTNDNYWNMTSGGSSFTLASYIGNIFMPGNITLSLPNIPTITSPAAVNATLPTTITWNPFAGASQYHAQIQSQQGWGVPPTYEWDGFTTGTAITKPLFFPSNGGNMVPGYYNLTLIQYPQANVGLGNTFPINPLTAPTATSGTTSPNGPQGFTFNPTPPAASSTQMYMDQMWEGFIGQGSMRRLQLSVM